MPPAGTESHQLVGQAGFLQQQPYYTWPRHAHCTWRIPSPTRPSPPLPHTPLTTPPPAPRRGSELLREVAWVIFDEIHYMQDRERGVVWEETLIFLDKSVKMVFLSATLSNSAEFAGWIAHVHQAPCHVVYTDYRPTPLQHYAFPLGGSGIFLVRGLGGWGGGLGGEVLLAGVRVHVYVGGGRGLCASRQGDGVLASTICVSYEAWQPQGTPPPVAGASCAAQTHACCAAHR